MKAPVHRLGHDIDTDQIIPGRYLSLQDPGLLGPHCLEGYDPAIAERLVGGAVLAAGRNFGCGSSRKHAPIALLAAGVRAVVAESMGRIFFRNSVNLALPVVICPEAARGLVAGMEAEIDLAAGRISQGGIEWHFQPMQGEVAAIIASGGLVPWVREALRLEG